MTTVEQLTHWPPTDDGSVDMIYQKSPSWDYSQCGQYFEPEMFGDSLLLNGPFQDAWEDFSDFHLDQRSPLTIRGVCITWHLSTSNKANNTLSRCLAITTSYYHHHMKIQILRGTSLLLKAPKYSKATQMITKMDRGHHQMNQEKRAIKISTFQKLTNRGP